MPSLMPHGKVAQVVTRRGVPSAVVLSIEEFEKFQRFEAAQSPSFIDHLLSMPTDDGEFERGIIQQRRNKKS